MRTKAAVTALAVDWVGSFLVSHYVAPDLHVTCQIGLPFNEPVSNGVYMYIFELNKTLLCSLPFRNWIDPTHRKIESNSDDSDDPEGLPVVATLIPEYDGKYDAAKIA